MSGRRATRPAPRPMPGVPPLGQRFRLKADVPIDDFSPTNQVILQALQTYGMLLADNGSDWFLSGVPDDRWDNDDLRALQERILAATSRRWTARP